MMDGRSYTKDNEGCRLVAYDDATGEPLKPGDNAQGTVTCGYGCTGPDIVAGLIWTQAQAENEFENRYLEALANATGALGPMAFHGLTAARAAALVDMTYQLGGRGILKFGRMLDAVRRADWPKSKAECLDSLYAKQAPHRAARNAEIFLTGLEPATK